MRWRVALLAAVGLAALAGSVLVPRLPRIVWNTTASTPIGLYAVLRRPPLRDELALIGLPPDVRALAIARGYLGPASLLIKLVAAVSGDRVCRVGFTVWVSGRKVANARVSDAQRHLLPTWRGCRVMGPGQIFILGIANDSFDSRYFGPIDARYIVGTAVPIWTFQSN
jgi:conjugative transfer signal peptidase TraF